MDMKRILQAMDGVATKPVAGADDMKKFVSIIKEGANPHKVALPVQMAMQHFQTPAAQPVQKKESLLKKYFTEAEEQIEEERAAKALRTRMYAQTIAERVLMKESALKDKDDLNAKRKALQDIQADPNTHKDEALKKELMRRKAALEKEAKERGLEEARLAPDQLAKLMQLKKQNTKPAEPQRPDELSDEQKADLAAWERDVTANLGSKLRPGPVQMDPVAAPVEKPAAPAAPAKPKEKDTLIGLQTKIAQLDKIIILMQQKEKLMLRAEKFPGGIERGLASDLEIEYGDPAEWTSNDYSYALSAYEQQIQKLQDFITRKKAAWSKPKTPKFMEGAEEAAPARDERTIQQEIKVFEKQLAKVEYAHAKAREITKEIKYDDTASSIITRIRQLAQSGIEIDQNDLQYAENDVFEAIKQLESAIYGLETAFKDAVDNAKNKVDDLESEVDEIQWNKKYGIQ